MCKLFQLGKIRMNGSICPFMHQLLKTILIRTGSHLVAILLAKYEANSGNQNKTNQRNSFHFVLLFDYPQNARD